MSAKAAFCRFTFDRKRTDYAMAEMLEIHVSILIQLRIDELTKQMKRLQEQTSCINKRKD